MPEFTARGFQESLQGETDGTKSLFLGANVTDNNLHGGIWIWFVLTRACSTPTKRHKCLLMKVVGRLNFSVCFLVSILSCMLIDNTSTFIIISLITSSINQILRCCSTCLPLILLFILLHRSILWAQYQIVYTVITKHDVYDNLVLANLMILGSI